MRLVWAKLFKGVKLNICRELRLGEASLSKLSIGKVWLGAS